MPDDQAAIRGTMREVIEACQMHQKALMHPLDEETVVDLRLGVEMSLESLRSVRDWLDERLR
jgi:hypothetical protein